jgi:hypothetical protein
MPDFDAINTALIARFAAAAITPPTGYDNVKISTGDLPTGMLPLPAVLVFPDEGTFNYGSAGGRRDAHLGFTVRFYYNQTGDLERDTAALRKWLDVLVEQLRAAHQLGGLTWSSGTRVGEVTHARVDSYSTGTFQYAGQDYTGIELNVDVLVNETLVYVA